MFGDIMKNNLLVTSAICGLAFFAATPAFADCDNTNPTTGQTVTCTVSGGTETNFVNGYNIPNVTVNMDPGAQIAYPSNDAGIEIGSGTITMGAGAVIDGSASYSGIYITQGGADITIGAGASVTGNTVGVYDNGTGSDTLTINLDGTINNGIASGARVILNLSNTGTITGTNFMGSSNDELHFIDTTGTTFDTDNLAGIYDGFEQHFKEGNTVTTLTGTTAEDWEVVEGTLLTNDPGNVANVAIDNGAVFELGATGTKTYSGDVSGTGEFRIANGSLVTLTGDNSGFTGLMNIDTNNTVTVGSANALGGGDISINQSTLKFSGAFTAANNIAIGVGDATIDTQANNAVLSGDLTGVAGHDIFKVGTGKLTISGDNSGYAGDINVDAGTLEIGSTNAPGNARIILDGGTLSSTVAAGWQNDLVLGAGNGTIDTTSSGFGLGGASTITGTGDLTVTGSHFFSFGATNSMSGGIIVDHSAITATGGTASLGDGSSTNTVTLDGGTINTSSTDTIAQDIVLSTDGGTFNATAGVTTYSGDFTGNNFILDKIGAGTVNLTGDLSALTVAQFDVDAGRLAFNNSTNANNVTVFVNNGGTLGGIGHVGGIEAQSGGIVAPGNSIGTLNVNGNANFYSGSIYNVEYNAAGQSDDIIATGTILVSAAAVLNLDGAAGSYAPSTTYTILEATGGTILGNSFGTINNNLAFLDASTIFNTHNVQLVLTRNNVAFSQPTENSTQAGAADAVEDLGLGNDLYDAFGGLTGASVPQTAESISGAGIVTTIPTMTATLMNPILAHIADAGASGSTEQHASAEPSDPSVYTAAYMEPAAGSGNTVDDNISMWLQARAVSVTR